MAYGSQSMVLNPDIISLIFRIIIIIKIYNLLHHSLALNNNPKIDSGLYFRIKASSGVSPKSNLNAQSILLLSNLVYKW